MRLRDIDRYLERIGHSGAPTLTSLHRAHVTAIPFENFDPLAGRAVSLEIEDLERKLVDARRGGYCFEQNLLFLAAITTLGLGHGEMLLARVRRGDEELSQRLTHLCVRVTDTRGTWLCDVGFGAGSLLEPAPFDVDVEADQSGWRYRLVRDGHEIVLQAFEDGQWNDNYSFIPTPAAFADVEASNRFTSTDPASPFVSGLFAGARHEDRELTLFTHERPTMHERIVGQPSIPTFVELSEVPRLLAQRFKIPGARVDEDGRVTL